MKRIPPSLAPLLALVLVLAAPPGRAEKELPGLADVSVVTAGKYAGTVQAYRLGPTVYLNALQVCRAYGGQPYWYQVTGRVFCSFKGRQARFTVNTRKAFVGDRVVVLTAPVAGREGQAFVPFEFFNSEAFVSLLGRTSRYDRSAKVIEVEPVADIGSPRHFSYGDRTRIEIEIGANLSWQGVKKGLNRFDVVFPKGASRGAERVSVDDGRVREIRLEQEKAVARLAILLASDGLTATVKELKDPRRLVVEVAAAEADVLGDAPASAGAASADDRRAAALTPPLAVPAPRREAKKRRIVIDPGHGGKDGGATGKNGLSEKDVNLAVAKELAESLRGADGFEVLLTRETDVFIPLEKRSEAANVFGADLFVSIHANASTAADEQGFEVYFLSEKASDTDAALVAQFENSVLGLQETRPADVDAAMILSSLEKAELINEAALAAGFVAKSVDGRVDLANRGVKQAQFYVLHWTRSPAILIELAFVTNKKDAAKLASKSFRRKLVDSIHRGILAFGRSKDWL